MVNDTQQIPAGYKQTDVGVIPEDWEVKELGSVCEKITTGKLDANAMKMNGEYRFYTCAKNYYFIDKYAFDDEALLISGNGANVGYIHYYKGKFNAYQRTYVLTGFSENIFFTKLLLDKNLSERIRIEVNAGNTPYITMGTLTEMNIPYPAKGEEQRQIAEVLSDIDSLISKLDQLIQKKKNIKQGAMQELLTGKRRLPGFSGVWMQFPLSDILLLNKGEQLNRSDLFNTGLYPAWNGGIDPSGYTDKWNTKENTITISEGGNSCGFVNICRQKFWCGGHCYAIKIKLKDLQNLFLYYALKYQEVSIMNLRVGSGLPNIQKKRLYGYELSIPADVSEQKEISNVLFDLDAELDLLEKQKLKYQNLRQGMMQQLLTGKIRLI